MATFCPSGSSTTVTALKTGWLLYSAACLLLSVYVHVMTYFGVSILGDAPLFGLLHLGVFMAVLPLIFQPRQGNDKARPRDKWKRIFQNYPPWATGVLAVLLAYAVFNFLTDFYLTSGGVPAIQNGRYVLESHSRIIRALSLEGFKHYQALAARAFSGGWLFFYAIPVLYLTCGRSPARSSPPQAAQSVKP